MRKMTFIDEWLQQHHTPRRWMGQNVVNLYDYTDSGMNMVRRLTIDEVGNGFKVDGVLREEDIEMFAHAFLMGGSS